MPAFRNVRSNRQSGYVPVAYDLQGWEVPIDNHATLQDRVLGQSHRRTYTPRPNSPLSHHPSPDRDSAQRSNSQQGDLSASNGNSNSIQFGGTSPLLPCLPLPGTPPSPALPAPLPMPVTRTTTKRRTSHSRQPKPGHIPRPKNAFIIFRSWYYKRRRPTPTPDGKKLNQNELSKEVGTVWRSMTDEQQAPFKARYLVELAAHAEKYPQYNYEPTNGKRSSAKLAMKKNGGGQKRGRKARRGGGGSGFESEGDEFEVEERGVDICVPVPVPASRTLRPRRPSRFAAVSPSPAPSLRAQSPTPSLSHSSSGSESEFSQHPKESCSPFVATEDIPPISLGPSFLQASLKKPQDEQGSTYELPHERPSSMDSDMDGFEVKVNPFLPLAMMLEMMPTDMLDTESMWPSDFEGGWNWGLVPNVAPLLEYPCSPLSPSTYPSSPLYSSQSPCLSPSSFLNGPMAEGDETFRALLAQYTTVNEQSDV